MNMITGTSFPLCMIQAGIYLVNSQKKEISRIEQQFLFHSTIQDTNDFLRVYAHRDGGPVWRDWNDH